MPKPGSISDQKGAEINSKFYKNCNSNKINSNWGSISNSNAKSNLNWFVIVI